jgi:peptidoglycan hydrolase-like protein with peptidoglycan-binding domain
MAPPKRKSPERKIPAKKRAPSMAARILRSTAAGIAHHPRPIAGAAAFGVVFSVVAANALWYQPKHHPAPLLATRMFEDAQNKGQQTRPGAADVAAADPGATIFRIERQSDESALEEVPADPAKQVASPLIREVQQALARRGLYDGPADGLTGPKTTAAILFFQESEGLQQTGEASVDLLARLKTRDTRVAVIPDERPSPDVTASTEKSSKSSDDVADLIRAAEAAPATAARSAKTADKTEAAVTPDMVMKIQKALSRFAYADIKVDGVAGEATRAAIRAFEKSYNLPVTGEPSERVVRKLKSIGAI